MIQLLEATMNAQGTHDHRPRRPCWTHIALKVKDVDATIAWYERHTHLSLLARHEDAAGRNAWIGDASQADTPLVVVCGDFYEGKDPFAPAPHPPLGPFAHIGIELPTREMVDELADRARADGCLGLGPVQLPDPIGYVCFIKDPDGNTIEFSYDQGVYETAREVWGAKAP